MVEPGGLRADLWIGDGAGHQPVRVKPSLPAPGRRGPARQGEGGFRHEAVEANLLQHRLPASLHHNRRTGHQARRGPGSIDRQRGRPRRRGVRGDGTLRVHSAIVMVEVVAVIRRHRIRIDNEPADSAIKPARDVAGEYAPLRRRDGVDGLTAEGEHDIPTPGGRRSHLRRERAAKRVGAWGGVRQPSAQRLRSTAGVGHCQLDFVGIKRRVVGKFVAGPDGDASREQNQEAGGQREDPEGGPYFTRPPHDDWPVTIGLLARSAQSRYTLMSAHPWAIRAAP